MPRPNFFNDNINRTFPFQWKSTGVNTPSSGPVTMLELPDDFIADCGFIMGPSAGFEEGIHQVFLYRITRTTETVVTYEFRSDAPNVLGVYLIFTRNSDDPTYTTEFVESDSEEPVNSQSASSSNSGDNVCGEPFWSGYLVTGPMASVFSRLSIGESITRTSGSDDEAVVEPGLIQNLNGNQVVSLNLANADRTRALRPGDCPPNQWPFETGLIYVNYTCLQGDIRLYAGHNLSLSQNNNTNSIQFAAVVNAGTGPVCEELKLFPAETPPVDATNNLLEGDFYCNEVFRSVNGVQGPNIQFFAGNGVTIIPDNSNNKLIVDINLIDLSLCPYSTVSASV